LLRRGEEEGGHGKRGARLGGSREREKRGRRLGRKRELTAGGPSLSAGERGRGKGSGRLGLAQEKEERARGFLGQKAEKKGREGEKDFSFFNKFSMHLFSKHSSHKINAPACMQQKYYYNLYLILFSQNLLFSYIEMLTK